MSIYNATHFSPEPIKRPFNLPVAEEVLASLSRSTSFLVPARPEGPFPDGLA